MAIPTRDKIIHTALKLVASGGLQACPMSELARKADIAVGTIYHYYTSKEEVIADLYLYCRIRTSEAEAKALAKDGKLNEKFERLWMALFEHYTKNGSEFRALEQFRHAPYLEGSEAGSLPMNNALSDFLKAGMKKGSLRKADVGLVTDLIHASVATGVNAHLAKDRKSPSKRDLKDLQDMAWNAIKG